MAQGTFSGLLGLFDAFDQKGHSDAVLVPFSTNQQGTVEMTGDWTNPNGDIDIWLYSGTCTWEQYVKNNVCTRVASSRTALKPETLTMYLMGAGTYTMALANAGMTTESGTYKVTLLRYEQ